MPESPTPETPPGSAVQVEPGRVTRVRLARAFAPRLLKVEVVGGLGVADAAPPHLEWDHAKDQATRQAPEVILHGQPLRLRVTLAGGKAGVASKLVCEVKGQGIDARLEADVTPPASDAWSQEVSTPGPLTQEVAVHALSLKVSLVVGAATEAAHVSAAPLRIYTIHAAPVSNTRYGAGGLQQTCKAHLEHVCRWADRATKNIGQGQDSIPHRVNNLMRHYVHPRDWTAPDQHFASVYAPGGKPPENYDDLRGWVRDGERAISGFYYPPLEPTKDYEKYYPHYQNNFGWKLLDNTTHTGGRCNQQASLYCELLGLLGIEAQVYYLQRVGFGPRTGRPVRQFFNCEAGGQFWNFHGIAKVKLDDGSYHMYDGSFSSPPNRKNGSEAWAIGERGPFIYSWSPWWQYQDTNTRVPADDIPTTWDGVP